MDLENYPTPPHIYKVITIRVRQLQTNYSLTAEPFAEKDAVKVENNEANANNGQKQKRTKERKIGEILDKVLSWRRLYTGVVDANTGAQVKMSLEEAAQKVQISKKSLDDYLLQIRFGKKYGFNFNDHYNERVGVLRAFVKKYKNKAPNTNDDDKSDLPDLDPLIDKKDQKKGVGKGSKKIRN